MKTTIPRILKLCHRTNVGQERPEQKKLGSLVIATPILTTVIPWGYIVATSEYFEIKLLTFIIIEP